MLKPKFWSATAVASLLIIAGLGMVQTAQADLSEYIPPIQRKKNTPALKAKSPELSRALRYLQEAKLELEKGSAAPSEERSEALQATKVAIAEVEEAIKTNPK